MKNLLILTLALTSASFASAQTSTYTGNGATGFGGNLGNGSLSITASGGVFNFSLTLSNNAGASAGTVETNNIAFYIDSVAGGFATTSAFTDTGGGMDNGRKALSGTNGTDRTTVNFASGFTADYGISLDSGFAGLFLLANNGSFTFVNSGNLVVTGGATGSNYSFSISATDLGLTAGQSFGFVATELSPSPYRSNESIGLSTAAPGTPGDTPNAGANGSLTFTNFNTVPIPEPSSTALVASAVILGGGFLMRRRRTA